MNTKKTETYYDILNGPSKDTLFDACKYACSENAEIRVDFTVAFGYTMPKGDPGRAYIQMAIKDVMIMGIENEDGSGESFNLHGYCFADLHPLKGCNPIYHHYRFKCHYSSKNRKGVIAFGN